MRSGNARYSAEAVVVGKSSQVCLASSAGESPGTGSCRRLAGPGVGERLREWREPGLPGLVDQIRGALGSTYLEPGVRELPLVRPASELGRVCLAGMAAVQQESTATGADAGGRARTREDGDLHRWTRVDVLPPDGMQEVSGSSPLSLDPPRK
jgi:hypothetical protein